MCLTLSGNLGANQNFDTADQALESAATNVNIHNKWAVDPKVTREAKKDVYKVIRGPSAAQKNFYLLAALSDMKIIFELCIKLLKKAAAGEKKKIQLGQLAPWKLDEKRREIVLDPKEVKRCLRKIEFYLSWANEHGKEYDMIR
jgi:hypothetical protein